MSIRGAEPFLIIRFQPLDETELASLCPLVNLDVLILNECQLPWVEVTKLASSIPNLKELYFAKNALDTLEPPLELPSLEVLNFDENSLRFDSSYTCLYEIAFSTGIEDILEM